MAKKLTKKDLERRNKFLLLQLKLIANLLKDSHDLDDNELFERIGKVEYLASPHSVKEKLELIEEFDKPYNFCFKTTNVKEYEV